MATCITNAGESLIAQLQAAQQPLIIDKFILGLIPGQDPDLEVPRTEGRPDAGLIVHEYVIPSENRAFINGNQVVYSMLLTSDIGDFSFNWVGLYCSEHDVIVAITHLPETEKWQSTPDTNTLGNALTRNFMLEFSGAQSLTQVTITAEVWQIDFTARLKGIDERERLSNRDIYGRACFWDDAYLVVNDGGSFSLQPGIAYVEGVRLLLTSPQEIAPTLPCTVYLDVCLMPQGSDVVALATPVFADPGDYTDTNLVAHYVEPIADIAADGTVTDRRATMDVVNGILQTLRSLIASASPDLTALLAHLADTNDPHATGPALLAAPHAWARAQTYAPTVLPIAAGAVIWDVSATPVAVIVLTEDITGLTVHNAVVGGSYELTLIQDGTGGRTMSWPASWLWPGGVAPDVSTDPLAEDIIHLTTRSAGGDAVAVRATVAQAFAGVA